MTSELLLQYKAERFNNMFLQALQSRYKYTRHCSYI